MNKATKKLAFFVTGTDTGVGKTLISAGLLIAAKNRGCTTLALKPVAAGCVMTDAGLRNDDALLLQSVVTEEVSYEQINPIALEPAIAPHIAAQQARRMLSVDRLSGYCRGILNTADFTLVEGAGGWRVPLNPSETLADLARMLQLPVILVVGIRLGCINHALLTVEAIQRDGVHLAGWVANCVDANMPCQEENIAALAQRIPAPCLGVVPWLEDVGALDQVAASINGQALSHLLGDRGEPQ